MSRDNSNKRIAKNVLALYVRMFFVMAISLYTSRVVLQILGVTDYGIYNVVGGVVSMIGLLKGSMAAATTRFITFEIGKKDPEMLRKTFCTSIMIYFFICLLFVFIAESVGLYFLNTYLKIPAERTFAANVVYQCTIFSVVIQMMSQPYNALIIGHEKMSIFAYISILEVILKLGIVYVLLLMPYDKLIVYGCLVLSVSLVIRLVYGVYCKKNFSECDFQINKDWVLFRRMLSYSGWNLFGAASGLARGQGLNVLLNMFFNPAVNAARGIAYQINGTIAQFSNNFYTAVRPQITKLYAQGNLPKMFNVVFWSSKMSFFMNMLIGIPLIVETPQIIDIWLGQIPNYVVIFSRLVIIISMIDAMSHPIMSSIQATGRVAFAQGVVGTLNISILPISFVFLRNGYPPETVFYISLFMMSLCVFVRLYILKREIQAFPVFEYISKVIGICFCVTVLSIILPVIVHDYVCMSFLGLVLNVVICLVWSSVIVFMVGLNKNERNVVMRFVANKLRKKK